MFVRRAMQEMDYDLLTHFFERDLGGKHYFNWKNFHDPLGCEPSNHQAICFEENEECLGIMYSRNYEFRINNRELAVNLLGDLGVDKRCKSRNVIINLFRHAYNNKSDLVMCFSDARKILTYEKIFHKYFTPRTQIIDYTEVTCQPQPVESRTLTELHHIPDYVWRNHLGRKRDQRTSNYLGSHPLYQKIHYLRDEEKYLTVGITEEYAEVIDISDTTASHFTWGLGVAALFRKNCRVLLHSKHAPRIIENMPVLLEKPVYMLVGYLTDLPILDRDRVWIGRIDRR
ncbi:hypothetical protein R69927_05450 [Paraburkholderia domus]|uniref:Uncharacterized protein n=2 Tax=Paraburkholderia domus TaxID=2793075 RepID=A0A9N8MQ54_9BURK|nr:hypothetical protein [Terracidiphilus sp.]CAE6787613.1 hypothetical protein R70006_04712 [Paraburkholderia domus]CAE6807247.1 hypothetical protein R75483_05629 [Paraburkholderia domus]CAE6850917.1 hypothetical protein R69749_04906 [Paraburkholderia domus]CAE6886317.1 hypothetical protein R70211_02430 [Paraburkholderia domus]